MKTITIIGSGMMGSALAFPARENGNRVRLVGTPLDRQIIDACRKTGQHPKFESCPGCWVIPISLSAVSAALVSAGLQVKCSPSCRSMCR